MNVLHYASFFDCSSLVETLVEADKGLFHCTHTVTHMHTLHVTHMCM